MTEEVRNVAVRIEIDTNKQSRFLDFVTDDLAEAQERIAEFFAGEPSR